jgi:hypothetical protein
MKRCDIYLEDEKLIVIIDDIEEISFHFLLVYIFSSYKITLEGVLGFWGFGVLGDKVANG